MEALDYLKHLLAYFLVATVPLSQALRQFYSLQNNWIVQYHFMVCTHCLYSYFLRLKKMISKLLKIPILKLQKAYMCLPQLLDQASSKILYFMFKLLQNLLLVEEVPIMTYNGPLLSESFPTNQVSMI